MDAKTKLLRARASLVMGQPFFASLALRMQLIEDTSRPTMATDGESLHYNPAFVESLPAAQLEGVLAHEVMHPALGHHTRRGERDPKLWNLAADFCVNPIVLASGFELPSDALVDARFVGMTADEVYRILDRERRDQQQDQQGNQPGSQGGQEPSQGAPDGDGSSDPGGCGEVLDAPSTTGNGPSAADIARAEQEAKIATLQAAQVAKAAGKLPAHLKRVVEEIKQPTVDWREELRRFMAARSASDFSWLPPNRRFVSRGLYLPSLRSTTLGPIVVAVDTSGSINDDTLAQFSAELNAIIEETKPERVHVIYCDAAISHTDEFDPEEGPIILEAHGGGGTDFRPPFSYVDEQGIDPACLLYLTDMECSRYPTDPGYPVLWVSSGRDNAPFGDVVRIKPLEGTP